MPKDERGKNRKFKVSRDRHVQQLDGEDMDEI